MRKRILSLLLCCVMLLGLMPVTAFADGEGSENTQNETIYRYYFSCKKYRNQEIIGYTGNSVYGTSDTMHFIIVKCLTCNEIIRSLMGKTNTSFTQAAPKRPPAPRAKPVRNAVLNTGNRVTAGAHGSPTATTRPTPAPASVKAAARLTRRTAAATIPRPVSRWTHAPTAARSIIADTPSLRGLNGPLILTYIAWHGYSALIYCFTNILKKSVPLFLMIRSSLLNHFKMLQCILYRFHFLRCRMLPRLFQFFYHIRSIIHRQS